MAPLPEIKINQFQLAILLDDKQKRGFQFLLDEGVYCSQCKIITKKGIDVQEIFLTKLNDILVRGKCKICDGQVARVIEFVDDKAFYEKASVFRKSIR